MDVPKRFAKRLREVEDSAFVPLSLLFRFCRVPVNFVSYFRGVLLLAFLGLYSYWPANVSLLIVAVFLDAADGAYARFVGSASLFGNRLDKMLDLGMFISVCVMAYFVGLSSLFPALACVVLSPMVISLEQKLRVFPERELVIVAVILAATGLDFVEFVMWLASAAFVGRLLWS